MLNKKITLLIVGCLLILSVAPYALAAANAQNVISGKAALEMLKQNNLLYMQSQHNTANISQARRQETATHGQLPYAIILSCADSRVPPEHIFNAGVGELFVMRNAGNVTSGPVLGSMEYAIEHLGVKLVVVLGHTKCGAVGAALSHDGHEHDIPSSLQSLVYDIHKNVSTTTDPRKAELLNVLQEIKDIHADPTLEKMIKKHNVLVLGALYDISTGKVEFLEEK